MQQDSQGSQEGFVEGAFEICVREAREAHEATFSTQLEHHSFVAFHIYPYSMMYHIVPCRKEPPLALRKWKHIPVCQKLPQTSAQQEKLNCQDDDYPTVCQQLKQRELDSSSQNQNTTSLKSSKRSKTPPEKEVEFDKCEDEERRCLITSDKGGSKNNNEGPQQTFPANPMPPYHFYINSGGYIQVYCRYMRPPLQPVDDYIDNDVSLAHLDLNQGGRKLIPFNKKIHRETQLKFNSHFQCGNLHCVFRKYKTHQYSLFVQNDTNTIGYNQWFYFSVAGMQPGVTYTFQIVNMRKSHSHFQAGFKPAIYSQAKADRGECPWYRDGNMIRYERSHIEPNSQHRLYRLTFTLTFDPSETMVLVAANLPYSYTKLQQLLVRLQQTCPADEISYKQASLCKSLCGNDIHQLTIESRRAAPRKAIIILARQHPGQTMSSFLMEQMLLALTTPSPLSKWLLDRYTFKIYPMLNPDGVIHGNYRCDVSGVDLNRQWRTPSAIIQPQISALKKRIYSHNLKYQIEYCLDLHGHSKNLNVFSYSCEIDPVSARIYPLFIAEQSQLFHFESCTFGLSSCKTTTARALISEIMGSQNVHTIECSGYGYEDSHKNIQHFQPSDFQGLAQTLLQGFRATLDKGSPIYLKTEAKVKAYIKRVRPVVDDAGSDSEPDKDQMDLAVKINKFYPAKFKKDYEGANKSKHITLNLQKAIVEEPLRKQSRKEVLKTPQLRLNQSALSKIRKPQSKNMTIQEPLDTQGSIASQALPQNEPPSATLHRERRHRLRLKHNLAQKIVNIKPQQVSQEIGNSLNNVQQSVSRFNYEQLSPFYGSKNRQRQHEQMSEELSPSPLRSSFEGDKRQTMNLPEQNLLQIQLSLSRDDHYDCLAALKINRRKLENQWERQMVVAPIATQRRTHTTSVRQRRTINEFHLSERSGSKPSYCLTSSASRKKPTVSRIIPQLNLLFNTLDRSPM